MVDELKIYSVNNILKGYTDYHKLSNIYSDLKKEVLTEDPIQESPNNLISIEGTRRSGSYGWKLFEIEDSLIMLEYAGEWEGYAHQSIDRPAIDKEFLSFLNLTIHNSNNTLEDTIEKILSKYPEK